MGCQNSFFAFSFIELLLQATGARCCLFARLSSASPLNLTAAPLPPWNELGKIPLAGEARRVCLGGQ